MIDIHTHILPNIDDGSTSLELSIRMLEEEIKQGVKEVYLTPHVCYGNKQFFKKEKLKKIYDEFCEKCKHLPIKLHLGQEIFFRSGSFEAFKKDVFLPLGNTNYYLVEFSMAVDFEDIEASVYNLICIGKKIIIAHPERYSYMNKDLMFRLREVGALFQINTSSILGVFGKGCKKRSKMFIKNGFADFVSSDCHDMQERSPNLKSTLDFIERKYKTKIKNSF